MSRPQTIQIFLPTGDPRSLRTAEITTRIVRIIEVPRSQLTEFLKTQDAQQVGVYFLLGDSSDTGLPRVYIGQSGSVGTRLVQHHQKKDFWNKALIVVSLTNSMTQTHALFLEWLAIGEATKTGRHWKPTATKFTKQLPPYSPRWVNPFLSPSLTRKHRCAKKNCSIAKARGQMALANIRRKALWF
jgi:hypothetical protein